MAINPKKVLGTLLCHVISRTQGLQCDVHCSVIYMNGEKEKESEKEERRGSRTGHEKPRQREETDRFGVK